MLDSLLCDSIAACMDFDAVKDIEERLAFALGRIEGTPDDELAARPRAMIASAIRMLADRYAKPDDTGDLHDRYLNAICRSVDPPTRHE